MSEQITLAKTSVSNLLDAFSYVYHYKLRKNIYEGDYIRCFGHDDRFPELKYNIFYKKIKTGLLYDTYELVYIKIGDLDPSHLNSFNVDMDTSDWVDVDLKHVKEHKRLSLREIKLKLLKQNMESKVGWP